MPDPTEPSAPSPHLVLGTLTDDFTPFDQQRLQQLPAQDRASQVAARRLLYDHVRSMWEHHKTHNEDWINHPHRTSLALMCDLAAHLWASADHDHLAASETGTPRRT